MSKHGKKYNAAAAQVVPGEFYDPRQALELVKKTSITKFDATVEVHMRMGLDPRQAEQQVRDVVVLPHGLGKTIKVLVFAQGEGITFAENGGADYVADNDDWIKKILDGFTDFDVAIATPDMMGKVGRLGRVLGPRGLMPNPKAGTVVPPEDLPRVIEEAKAGRVEFRLDKTANIHVPIGKVSFELEKLYDNMAALMEAIKKAKPSTAKGSYIRRITVTSTMGPGIKVDTILAQNMEAAE
jgi:large subunit ribosomal protein L1